MNTWFGFLFSKSYYILEINFVCLLFRHADIDLILYVQKSACDLRIFNNFLFLATCVFVCYLNALTCTSWVDISTFISSMGFKIFCLSTSCTRLRLQPSPTYLLAGFYPCMEEREHFKVKPS